MSIGDGDNVNIRVKLQQAREFVHDAESAAKGVGQLGDKTRKAGETAHRASGGFLNFRKRLGLMRVETNGSLAGIAALTKSMLGVGAAYLGWHFAHEAITQTTDLATTTARLSQAFNMSSEAASEYAASFQAFHVNTTSASMGFTSLSRAVQAGLDPASRQAGAFRALGISAEDLHSKGNDVDAMFQLVASHLSDVQSGSERAAIGQALLGRGYQQLQPLLRDHGKILAQTREEAEKYGATLGGKSLADMRKFQMQQHAFELATMGLKVQFATGLAPALTRGMAKLAGWVGNAREGKGVAGDFADVLKQVAHVTGTVIDFFDRHDKITKTLMWSIVGLTAATKGYEAVTALWGMGSTLVRTIVMGIRFLRWEFAALGVSEAAATGGLSLLIPAAAALGFALGAAIVKLGGFRKTFSLLGSGLKAVGVDIYHWLTWPFRKAFDYIEKGWDKLPGPLQKAMTASGEALTAGFTGMGLPGYATGGLSPGGWSIVGENGPEVRYLDRNTRVKPIADMKAGNVNAFDFGPMGEAMAPGVVHTEVKIDRKVVGEAWNTYVRDKRARR